MKSKHVAEYSVKKHVIILEQSGVFIPVPAGPYGQMNCLVAVDFLGLFRIFGATREAVWAQNLSGTKLVQNNCSFAL